MGNLEVASPFPVLALLRMMLRPHLLCHADITAESPIPWPQKLCFRASILPLCTQFTASYSSFGSFCCVGTRGIFASLFLIAIVLYGLCFLLAPVVSLVSFFSLWMLFFFPPYFFFILGCWIRKMEKRQWDKYQSGNKHIASVLGLEAKHGLFGCQANLKMLSTVAKVHEKCSKLFPRVLGSLNCSNPNVPEELSIKGEAYLVLLLGRNKWETVYLFLLVYIADFCFSGDCFTGDSLAPGRCLCEGPRSKAFAGLSAESSSRADGVEDGKQALRNQ